MIVGAKPWKTRENRENSVKHVKTVQKPKSPVAVQSSFVTFLSDSEYGHGIVVLLSCLQNERSLVNGLGVSAMHGTAMTSGTAGVGASVWVPGYGIWVVGYG